MRFHCKTLAKCLFCNDSTSPDPQVDLEVEQVHSAHSNDSKDPDPTTCSCYKYPNRLLQSISITEEQIQSCNGSFKYVFVLRQLLDYPENKVLRHFKQRIYPKDEDDGWFSICKKCTEFVQRGHSYYHEIEELQQNLSKLKNELKDTIISSHNLNNTHHEGIPIYSEVLRHFVPGKKSLTRETESIIVKTEVDVAVPEDNNTTYDGDNLEDDFVANRNDMDFDDNVSHSSDEQWVPSERDDDHDTDDDLDIKPDMTEIQTFQTREGNKHKEFTVQSRRKSMSPEPHGRRLRSQRSKVRSLEESDSDEDAALRKKMSSHSFKIKRNVVLDSESDSEIEKSVQSEEKPQYSCRICSTPYYTKHRLKEHESLHRRNNAIECTKCKFVCTTSRAIKIHMTKYHSKKPKAFEKQRKVSQSKSSDSVHFCSHCKVVYKTAHRLKEHKEVHDNPDALQCEVCSYVCLLERGMKIHMTKYHPSTLIPEKPATDGSDSEMKPDQQDAHSCEICNAVYKTKHRLKEHAELHQNKRAKKCTKCPYVCKTIRQLHTHQFMEHSDNLKQVGEANDFETYTCRLCPAKYKTERRLKEHAELHNNNDYIMCAECGWVFGSEAMHKYHLVIVHKQSKRKSKKRDRPKEGPFRCDHCPAIYESRAAFRDHVYVNHKDKLVQCEHCDRCFESTQLLDIHHRNKRCQEADDHPKNKPFVCEQCSASFSTEGRLLAHVASLHEKGKFHCSMCPAVLPTESRFKFHMSRAHEKIHNVCKTCGYKAHGSSHLRLHMQKHTKQKMYMCELCSKTFTSPVYLSGHKQKEHFEELGVEPIRCDQCDLLLPSKSQLKYHIQKAHEKNFKYFCEACGKGFLFLSSLKGHAKVHTTDRTEVCQFCGANYVHNRALMDHMKNHHPEAYAEVTGKELHEIKSSTIGVANDGPHVCKFCDMQFTMKYHLHTHLKTHTEVYEKYKCETCGKGYSSQAGVKRHEETAHTSRIFHCVYCEKEFPCRDYLRYHIKNHCRKKKAGDAEVFTESNSQQEYESGSKMSNPTATVTSYTNSKLPPAIILPTHAGSVSFASTSHTSNDNNFFKQQNS